jgi:hypothetical protein
VLRPPAEFAGPLADIHRRVAFGHVGSNARRELPADRPPQPVLLLLLPAPLYWRRGLTTFLREICRNSRGSCGGGASREAPVRRVGSRGRLCAVRPLTHGGSALRGSRVRRWAQVVIIDSRAVQAPAGWVVLATECVAGRLAKIGNEDALRC